MGPDNPTVGRVTISRAPEIPIWTGPTRDAPGGRGRPERKTVIGISTSSLFAPSFAHNVRTENPHIITSFANLDHAHIGTYGAPLESFGCPVQKRGVIIGRLIRYDAGKSLGDALVWDEAGATEREALTRGRAR